MKVHGGTASLVADWLYHCTLLAVPDVGIQTRGAVRTVPGLLRLCKTVLPSTSRSLLLIRSKSIVLDQELKSNTALGN